MATEKHENVTCPFCGLLCDDLSVARPAAGRLQITGGQCPKAAKGFERTLPGAEPAIGGRAVSLEAAIGEAARLVRTARTPLITGLGTDVEGMRAVMALADRAGGVVDHALSDGMYRNTEVLQTSGWFMTTLTEVRNRADLIIIVGTDVATLKPRFFERIAAVEEPMFLPPGKTRTIVFLGDGLDASTAKGGRIGDVLSIPCRPDAVGEVISTVRARLKGAPIAAAEVGGVALSAIDDLVARCRAAAYGVIAWGPGNLAPAGADLTVRAISDLVKDLNLTTRFAGLSLGGSEGVPTAAAVAAWQSGFPLRVSFAGGKPAYDTRRYAALGMIERRDADLVVWIASFMPDLAPPATDIPLILLGTPGIPTTTPPAVSIPVGTPGLDHAGRLVRCDSVVSLPLPSLDRSSLPAVADVLARIQASL